MKVLSENLHFRFEFNPAGGPRPFTNHLDQIQHVARRGVAFVDNEIAVHVRDHRAADARALQAEFVDQFARRDGLRVFENTTGARRRRLRFPSLLAELRPCVPSLPAPKPAALEHRAQRNVILEQRTTAILNVTSLALRSCTLPA